MNQIKKGDSVVYKGQEGIVECLCSSHGIGGLCVRLSDGNSVLVSESEVVLYNQTKEECCAECSTPASGAPDETQKECLNPHCKYCHQTKEGLRNPILAIDVKKHKLRLLARSLIQRHIADNHVYESNFGEIQINKGMTSLEDELVTVLEEAEQRVAREIKEKLEAQAYLTDVGGFTDYLQIKHSDFNKIFKYQ